ncbi:MAG: hypothetical protein LBE24_06090 [Methylobacillus sp.]|jgi:hypothetical protein|nr:hypothetical protein [Methylobacillus sp.]
MIQVFRKMAKTGIIMATPALASEVAWLEIFWGVTKIAFHPGNFGFAQVIK